MSTAPKDSPAARQSPDEISQQIVTDINKGVLGPGEWLKQIDLEKRYGCTRIKVRDALTNLHSKRLVEHIPNRGYRVPHPDPTRIRQVGEVRALLESHAAADVIDQATEADIAELRALAEAFKEAAYHGSSFAQIEANYAFHAKLYSFCRNDVLREMMLDLRQRGPAAPVGQWQTMDQLLKATQGHFDLVDAIEKRDLPLLKARITSHISGMPVPLEDETPS
ncbi:GntR family transcriptional regulator [Pseudodonghicola flavimaris]|uniref:GntR family transcriptional regulator n=1 Tax=Pseudodonghicola flavimaris TaxID=3050036 RepID=A0ABT7F840_9RHOB|nr:GntR family transcriptional regulator [Pseudodonghicola flavimaris]MDK3020776.1 GntR family transcriptional regulator [Pseudodonghicola flavimaris]